MNKLNPRTKFLELDELEEGKHYIATWLYNGVTNSDTVKLDNGVLVLFETAFEEWIKAEWVDNIKVYYLEILWTLKH